MPKKTFKKKSTAKHARKKGQSLYKVKGGWRISSGKKKRKASRRKTRRRRKKN